MPCLRARCRTCETGVLQRGDCLAKQHAHLSIGFDQLRSVRTVTIESFPPPVFAPNGRQEFEQHAHSPVGGVCNSAARLALRAQRLHLLLGRAELGAGSVGIRRDGGGLDACRLTPLDIRRRSFVQLQRHRAFALGVRVDAMRGRLEIHRSGDAATAAGAELVVEAGAAWSSAAACRALRERGHVHSEQTRAVVVAAVRIGVPDPPVRGWLRRLRRRRRRRCWLRRPRRWRRKRIVQRPPPAVVNLDGKPFPSGCCAVLLQPNRQPHIARIHQRPAAAVSVRAVLPVIAHVHVVRFTGGRGVLDNERWLAVEAGAVVRWVPYSRHDFKKGSPRAHVSLLFAQYLGSTNSPCRGWSSCSATRSEGWATSRSCAR